MFSIVVNYAFGVNKKTYNDFMQWHAIKDKVLGNLWNFRDFWKFLGMLWNGVWVGLSLLVDVFKILGIIGVCPKQ